MSTDKMKVLVYGSTSVQGGPIVRRLLEQGYQVRALIHHPEKAASLSQTGTEIALADLADRSSLEKASQDVDAIFLLLPQIIDRQIATTYMRNAVDAAEAARVKHLVYTSSGPIPSEPTDVLHFEIKREVQAYLQQSRVPSIVLRPTVYLENLSLPPIPTLITQQKVVPFPYANDARVSWITVEDQDEVFEAPSGTFIYLPKRKVHWFTLDTDEARLLTFTVPGGNEEFFRGLGEVALTLSLPPRPPAGPPPTGMDGESEPHWRRIRYHLPQATTSWRSKI